MNISSSKIFSKIALAKKYNKNCQGLVNASGINDIISEES